MSIVLPAGFKFAAVHCGIKFDASREDLAMVVADRPAVAAGVYTQNVVYAAPVAVDRERTPMSDFRAVVVNSGNANACTGQRGLEDALRMAQLAAEANGADARQSLVMSTGVIGEFLPMDCIAQGIREATTELSADSSSFDAASRGIMTTDKGPKTAGRVFSVGDDALAIAGMAKGAGMIGPRMATMLGIVMTDAALAPEDAQQALKAAVDVSFNCISVEGHTSTNDTVVLLASGASRAEPLAGEALNQFRESLTEVCIELARQIPDDGEGASHLITIEVKGCATNADAKAIAKTVSDSALVKTAITGCDPNWGRIVSAAGYAGVPFDPRRVRLTLNGTVLYEAGAPVAFDAEAVSKSMLNRREVQILLEFGEGKAAARCWTSDLTVDYVRFNSDYRT